MPAPSTRDMILLDRTSLRASPCLQNHADELAGLTDTEGRALVSRRSSAEAWKSMRTDLERAQHNKCGWCEKVFDHAEIEIDHVRPKNPDMYWWLAFHLNNLLASCRSCNNIKRAAWPLAGDSARLVPRQSPDTTSEPALVIDPTREDPGPWLTFVHAGGEWRVAGRGERGGATVRVLGLDRDHRRRQLNAYARASLDPCVRQLTRCLAGDDRRGFDAAVGELVALSDPQRSPWSLSPATY